MSKDRLAAFTDAVVAIIMTILVLELEKPAAPTLEALWNLRAAFFAYLLSFWWLGSFWVSHHMPLALPLARKHHKGLCNAARNMARSYWLHL